MGMARIVNEPCPCTPKSLTIPLSVFFLKFWAKCTILKNFISKLPRPSLVDPIFSLPVQLKTGYLKRSQK